MFFVILYILYIYRNLYNVYIFFCIMNLKVWSFYKYVRFRFPGIFWSIGLVISSLIWFCSPKIYDNKLIIIVRLLRL